MSGNSGSDMTSVNIRVGHDDDLVVAALLDIEVLAADTCTQGRDQGADLGRTQHPTGMPIVGQTACCMGRVHGRLRKRAKTADKPGW